MTITLPRRFRGPHDSGNGGYTCGLAAALLDGPVEVTLRKPPPLETPMRVEPGDPLSVYDGDALVLTARPAALELEPPTPPSFEEATAMSAHYVGRDGHAFGECFVCGPDREEGDGLRIFAGRLPDTDGPVASPFVPTASLVVDGRIPDPVIWAALDCPGGWGASAPEEVVVLGRMTARIDDTVAVGERCVVIGWSLGAERRKRFAGTALFGEDGRLVGVARQTWITVDRMPT